MASSFSSKALGLTQPETQWAPGFFLGGKQPEREVNH